MKHIWILMLVLAAFSANAAKFTANYIGKPLSYALAEICRNNPELNISFIYDQLENYKVKGRVNADNAVQAIRQLVAFNPVSVTSEGDHIYVEALQKGRYNFTGRMVSPDMEPIGFATVFLLNPKDSTAITYGLTDTNGRFSIPCDRHKVIAKFSSLGYKTRYIPTSSFSLGNVKMDILAIDLKGVTATADSRYVLSDRTVYIPSGREKNAAQGGKELLQFMAIPTINVSIIDKSITTLSGKEVSTFINYLPATSSDLDNLRTADVKRVEVLDFPSDPRFEGAQHAINFIVEEYLYGGYTRLRDQQRLDFKYGYYSLNSKFSYKKMTYDLLAGYDHFKSDREHANSVSEYDFNGKDLTYSQSTPESRSEDNEAYVSMRARYSTDKTVISNQISLRHKDNPDNYAFQTNNFSPQIHPDGESSQSSSARSLTPSWRGIYQFSFPRSIRLVINSSATYARNKRHSIFSENNIDILNNVKEDAWNASLSAGFSKQWGKHTLNASLSGEYADNRLHYTGTNPADIHYSYNAVGAFLSGNLSFGKVWLQPSVKFFFSNTSFGDRHFSQPLPGYYIAGGINFNRRHRLSVSSEMSQWTIGASQRSPNIVVRNLIDAVQGNPELKTWLYNSADIDYVWLPANWLNFGMFGRYIRHTRPIDYKYIPTEIDGREMMLQTYVKDGYFQDISGGVSATVRLFDNSLTLRGQLAIDNYRRGGARRYDHTFLNGSISASYYLGNFYFTGTYQMCSRSASTYTNKSKTPSYYSISAGWSSKGWNLTMQINNPFRSDWLKMTDYSHYDNFSRSSSYYGSAYRRQFWITASYTFSYGKKVNHDGIDRGRSVSSGIVN